METLLFVEIFIVYFLLLLAILFLGGDIMTSKELLYVEDALGHENFMKSCSKKTSGKLTDPALSTYVGELEQKHAELFDKFLKLL